MTPFEEFVAGATLFELEARYAHLVSNRKWLSSSLRVMRRDRERWRTGGYSVDPFSVYSDYRAALREVQRNLGAIRRRLGRAPHVRLMWQLSPYSPPV